MRMPHEWGPVRCGRPAAAALGGAALVAGLVHDVWLRSPYAWLALDGRPSLWTGVSAVLLGSATLVALHLATAPGRRRASTLLLLGTVLLLVGEVTPLGSAASRPLTIALALSFLLALASGALAGAPRAVASTATAALALFAAAALMDVATPKRLDEWGRSTRPIVVEGVLEESLETAASALLVASLAGLAGLPRRRGPQ